MKYNYRNTEIFYKFVDRKKQITNVYLHGWGCNSESLDFCDEVLKDQNSLYIDFPPFGKSGRIKGWSIFTYANMVISLCNHLKLTKVNLIGHSFGGRVAIIFAVLCKDQTQNLVLIDSAGLKPRRTIKYRINQVRYKICKVLKKDTSKFESGDYKILDVDMKKVFKSVVATHLDDFLPFIRSKALIIFGEKDKETPLYMAKKFKKNIPNSTLLILKNSGHFCFNDSRIEFVYALQKFLN